MFCSPAWRSATVLAGCYTYDPYSNEKKVSKTTTGAGIGAAVGAVAGILTGDDSRDRRKRAPHRRRRWRARRRCAAG